MRNKIILSAETTLQDNELREWFEDFTSKFITKLDTINERTKRFTIEIKNLEKRIKFLEER